MRIKWNEGAHGRKSFLESPNVKCGPNVIAGLQKYNSLRLSNARCKITEKYKETQTSVTFQGGFSTKIIPYVDFPSHGSVSKIQTQDMCKTITFVSDVDVWYFSILLPWAKLKYLYFIETIESNTQCIPYFTLNWISPLF